MVLGSYRPSPPAQSRWKLRHWSPPTQYLWNVPRSRRPVPGDHETSVADIESAAHRSPKILHCLPVALAQYWRSDPIRPRSAASASPLHLHMRRKSSAGFRAPVPTLRSIRVCTAVSVLDRRRKAFCCCLGLAEQPAAVPPRPHPKGTYPPLKKPELRTDSGLFQSDSLLRRSLGQRTTRTHREARSGISALSAI